MTLRPLTYVILRTVAAVAAAAPGCARRPAPVAAPPSVAAAPTTAPSTVPAPEYPVIVQLVGRDKQVVISSGPNGPVYSAFSKRGTALATNLTLTELREYHPDLYRFVHPAVVARASDDSSSSEPLLLADIFTGPHAGR